MRLLPIAVKCSNKTNYVGLGRVRFCVPGDVGRSEFSVSFVRSRCFSRAVRIPTRSEDRRALTTDLPNKHRTPSFPATQTSPDSAANAKMSSLPDCGGGHLSEGLSQFPLTGC